MKDAMARHCARSPRAHTCVTCSGDASLLCSFASSSEVAAHRVEVYACGIFDQVVHAYAAPGRRQVDVDTLVLDLRSACARVSASPNALIGLMKIYPDIVSCTGPQAVRHLRTKLASCAFEKLAASHQLVRSANQI